MIERSIKPDKGLRKAAAWWFGLLGVIAATAAVVLVPISMDPDMLSRNPAMAYHPRQLRVLLTIAEALLVTVLGVLILGGRRVGVPVLIPALVLLGVSAASTFFSETHTQPLRDRSGGLLSLGAGVLLLIRARAWPGLHFAGTHLSSGGDCHGGTRLHPRDRAEARAGAVLRVGTLPLHGPG